MLWAQLIEEANYVILSLGEKQTRITATTLTFGTGLRCSRNDYENTVRLLQIDQDHKTTFQVQGRTRQETSAVQLCHGHDETRD